MSVPADEVLVDLHITLWRGPMAERTGAAPEDLSAHQVLADMHVAMWREQMAQRERAEDLQRRLSDALGREAAWAGEARARGGSWPSI